MRLSSRLGAHLRQNVVGYVALFAFALAGTAYALPGKNSVDSGDLKKGSVHTSDIAKKAVTAPKLRPGAVGSSAVADDSLTGADIDESTLTLPKSPPATEPEPIERRVVFPAAAFHPATASLSNQNSGAVLEYSDSLEQFAFLSAEVPFDRVVGTGLTIRLLWTTPLAGDVDWTVTYQTIAPGQTIDAPALSIEKTLSSGTSTLETTEFTVPGASLQNGMLLAINLTREGNDGTDTNPSLAKLYALDLEYTAEG